MPVTITPTRLKYKSSTTSQYVSVMAAADLSNVIDDNSTSSSTIWSSQKTNQAIDSQVIISSVQPQDASNKLWISTSNEQEISVPTYAEFTALQNAAAGPNEWLEKNDLDATITGKINVLSVPYTLDDIEKGKIIYSNGTIQNSSSCCVSPLVPISAGTYGLKTAHNEYIGGINSGNSYQNGYGFFAADGVTVVSRPTNLLHSLGNDIYVFEVPNDAAYVRFCYLTSSSTYYEQSLGYFNQWILLPDANDNIDDSFFVVQVPKPNIEIDKLLRIDGSYATLRDTTAREDASEALARPITFGRKTCAVFEKVCCIGDSYTAGYIYNTSGTAVVNNQYSWVEHIKNATGREYVNCGFSGATTKNWLTNADGLAKAQLPENKAQAYIVALQINDAATELAVGTVSDIGTSAQTYCGCTSKIIDEIFTINNAAHIFFLTQPKNYTGEHTPYRRAELDVIDWYQSNGTHQNQVHLIDLLDYWKLFQNPGCYDSTANGHYTGVGWEYAAEIIMYAWSNYMDAHPLIFQDANLIPFYATPKVNDVQANGTSIVTNGIANIPVTGLGTLGLCSVESYYGLSANSSGRIYIAAATSNNVKGGAYDFSPIVPSRQHEAVFYGLSKVAGVDLASETVTTGTYPTTSKAAIQKMLGVPNTTGELIYETTLTADATEVVVNTDSDGDPFKLIKAIVLFTVPPMGTGSRETFYGSAKGTMPNGIETVAVSIPSLSFVTATSSLYSKIVMIANKGMPWECYLTNATGEGNTQATYTMARPEVINNITYIRIYRPSSTAAMIPSGTNIKVYGIREYE